MSQPDRFDAADLRCDACQSNTDIYGIMKTHNKGRWVKWEDYAALAAENANLIALQWETLKERNKAEAENERLIKAGDAMCRLITSELHNKNGVHKMLLSWLDAAKEGRDAK